MQKLKILSLSFLMSFVMSAYIPPEKEIDENIEAIEAFQKTSQIFLDVNHPLRNLKIPAMREKQLFLSMVNSGTHFFTGMLNFFTDSYVLRVSGDFKGSFLWNTFGLNLCPDVDPKVLHLHDCSAVRTIAEGEKLIVLVRDYKELFVKSCMDEMGILIPQKYKKRMENRQHFLEISLDYLRIYDEWQGEKALFYYEDLIMDPHQTAKQLGQFLSVPDVKVRELDACLPLFSYICHFSRHHNFSTKRQSYGLDTRHYQKRISKKDRKQLGLAMKKLDPRLYQLYLKRYSYD